MLRNLFQLQPFHLVTSSPWPILTSFSLLIFTSASVIYFNGYTNTILHLLIGLFITIFSCILWFKDIIIEGQYLGDHTILVQKGLIIGFILFLISEIFIFISIFWAILHSSLSPNIELGINWPPLYITTINPFHLPILNTFLLLSSGAIVTFSHHAIIQRNRSGAIIGLFLTILFATIFTICQGIEYYYATFTITDGIFGSIFYFSTAIHGFHVIIGTIFLSIALFRIINYHFSNFHHLGFEAGILYWHLVDFIWILLFIILYWWAGL